LFEVVASAAATGAVGTEERLPVRQPLVEADRTHPLHPVGALVDQVLIEPHLGPHLGHLRRGNPRLGQPAILEELTQVLRVQPVGLGVPLLAPGRRGLAGIGQVHPDPDPLALLGDEPPAGASLHRQIHLSHAGESLQPAP